MRVPASNVSVFFAGLLFLLAACGGGGGGGGSDDDDDDSGSGGGQNSLNLELKAGEFWEFVWNASSVSFAQGSGSTGGATSGTFRITLGAPVSINGQEAFPLVITGGPGDFAPRWAHVAISENGSLLGSTDGITLTTVYDAETEDWLVAVSLYRSRLTKRSIWIRVHLTANTIRFLP